MLSTMLSGIKLERKYVCVSSSGSLLPPKHKICESLQSLPSALSPLSAALLPSTHALCSARLLCAQLHPPSADSSLLYETGVWKENCWFKKSLTITLSAQEEGTNLGLRELLSFRHRPNALIPPSVHSFPLLKSVAAVFWKMTTSSLLSFFWILRTRVSKFPLHWSFPRTHAHTLTQQKYWNLKQCFPTYLCKQEMLSTTRSLPSTVAKNSVHSTLACREDWQTDRQAPELAAARAVHTQGWADKLRKVLEGTTEDASAYLNLQEKIALVC